MTAFRSMTAVFLVAAVILVLVLAGGAIGGYVGATGNSVTVIGAGSQLNNTHDLTIGYGGNQNSLTRSFCVQMKEEKLYINVCSHLSFF